MNCPHCNQKIIEYPIKDNNGKIIWKNLLLPHLDFVAWMFLLIILFNAFAYKHDMAACYELRASPCSYCGPYQDIKAQQTIEPGLWAEDITLNETKLLR